MSDARNVFGEPLAECCTKPMTGFYRDGSCNTGPEDSGLHTVCTKVDPAFLAFSRAAGNDLSQGVGAEAFLYGQAASLVGQRVGSLFGLDSFRGFDESVNRDRLLGGAPNTEKRVGGFNGTSHRLVQRKLL